MQLVRLLLAILLPPAAVFLTYGFSFTLLVSIGLTLLGAWNHSCTLGNLEVPRKARPAC